MRFFKQKHRSIYKIISNYYIFFKELSTPQEKYFKKLFMISEKNVDIFLKKIFKHLYF